MRTETSPSPSTWSTIASAGAGTPARSSAGPFADAAGSQSASAAANAASTSRAARSAAGSTRSGTREIANVFISRGMAR